jgi:hypothetical protein
MRFFFVVAAVGFVILALPIEAGPFALGLGVVIPAVLWHGIESVGRTAESARQTAESVGQTAESVGQTAESGREPGLGDAAPPHHL